LQIIVKDIICPRIYLFNTRNN